METYPDRWQRKADEPLTLYVPSPTAGFTVKAIAPGSGIVGRPGRFTDGRIEICYEGNLYQACNLGTYQEKVSCAAGRLITDYPTLARAFVEPEHLVDIGTYVPRTQKFVFTNPTALSGWVEECLCRNHVCGHPAVTHLNGTCVVIDCRCGPGGWR